MADDDMIIINGGRHDRQVEVDSLDEATTLHPARLPGPDAGASQPVNRPARHTPAPHAAGAIIPPHGNGDARGIACGGSSPAEKESPRLPASAAATRRPHATRG
jgi:hypothetical protein